MFTAFDYIHIQTALKKAIKMSREVGTDADTAQIEYALKLLRMQESTVFCSAGEQKWGNENEDEMKEWGHD